jgi:hypothetical protein
MGSLKTVSIFYFVFWKICKGRKAKFSRELGGLWAFNLGLILLLDRLWAVLMRYGVVSWKYIFALVKKNEVLALLEVGVGTEKVPGVLGIEVISTARDFGIIYRHLKNIIDRLIKVYSLL